MFIFCSTVAKLRSIGLHNKELYQRSAGNDHVFLLSVVLTFIVVVMLVISTFILVIIVISTFIAPLMSSSDNIVVVVLIRTVVKEHLCMPITESIRCNERGWRD